MALYDRVWNQIPASDLEVKRDDGDDDPGYSSATLEIKLPHHLLADDVQIVVAPSTNTHLTFESVHHVCFDGVTPIVVYALTDADSLSSSEVDDLMELKRLAPRTAVFFIRAQRPNADNTLDKRNCASPVRHEVSAASELTESQQHTILYPKNALHSPPNSPTCPSPVQMDTTMDVAPSSPPVQSAVQQPPPQLPSLLVIDTSSQSSSSSSLTLFQQLSSLGFLSPCNKLPPTYSTGELFSTLAVSPRKHKPKKTGSVEFTAKSELVENFENFASILLFVRQALQSHLVRAANTLHNVHMRCLRVFILTAFDMTRDMMITPKRIEYARQKEQQLFDSLMAIANKKQEEIKNLISETLTSMRPDLLEECGRYTFKNNSARLNSGCCCVEASGHSSDPDHSRYSSSSGSEPERRPRRPSSANGSIQAPTSPTKISARDYQLALTEIQDFVLNHLNTAIAGKLIGSVDYLRDSYVGTLERCLSALEKFAPAGESPHEALCATNALKQILNAAYQVEINIKATSSLLRALWEKLKQIVTSSMLWRTQVRRRVAMRARSGCL